jgi:BirA family biotin operon repressor/biotin-[acetyl-CoA-carboxylase] ligase
VKWPNDVLHEGRKVCGILAEARPARPDHVLVIGTGLNVNQRAEDFPPELRDRATSLRAAGGTVVDRPALLGVLLARLDRYRVLAAREGAEALRSALLPWLPAPGSRVVVQTVDRRVEGTVEEILETGALLVRDASGERFPIVAGEIPFGMGGPA